MGEGAADYAFVRNGIVGRSDPGMQQHLHVEQRVGRQDHEIGGLLPFDAAGIDLGIVARLVRESLADADLEGVESVYPSIRRPDVAEDPVISIPISGVYYSAYYSYTVDGELIQRTGTAFD